MPLTASANELSAYSIALAESNCSSSSGGASLRLSMNELGANDYLPSAYGMQYEDFLRYQSNELDYDQLKDVANAAAAATSTSATPPTTTTSDAGGGKCIKYPDTNQNYDDYEAEAYNNAMLLTAPPPPPTSAASGGYYTQLPYGQFPLQLAVPFQQTTAPSAAAYGQPPMQGSYLHYGNYYETNGGGPPPQLLPQAAGGVGGPPSAVAMQQHPHGHPHSHSHPHHALSHHAHFATTAGGAAASGMVGVGVGVGEMLFDPHQQQHPHQQRKDDEISNILAGVRKTCYSN